MKSRRKRPVIALAVASAVALAISACSSTTKTGSSGSSKISQVVVGEAVLKGRPDITKFCGTKPMKIAFVAGFAGNAWFKTVHYMFDQYTKKCSNITQTFWQDANGDPQAYSSDIQSLVSQGVNAIVTYDTFGAAGLPAIRAAYKAGVAIVPEVADPGGTPGVDYTSFAPLSSGDTGKAWGVWLNEALHGTGNVIMLGGIAGNTSSPAYIKGFVDNASAYSGLKLLSTTPVTTQWTVAGEQQATAGLLSKYPQVDGLMTDYLATYSAVLRAYQAAGRQPGPVAGFTSSNEDGCLWDQYHSQYPSWQMYSIDGSPNAVYIATNKAVAAYQGIKDPEADTLLMEVSIDTLHGKMPKCDSSLPPDTDFSTPLTAEQLHAALGS